MMDYRKKYLKYKEKYLNLKNLLEGGKYDSQIINQFNKNSVYVTLNDETNKQFMDSNYASTYGELTYEGFHSILKKVNKILELNRSSNILAGLKFADLGSGLGKVPLMAFNEGAEESVGIEFAKERFIKAQEMYNNLKPSIKQNDLRRYNNLRYINGDILLNNDLDEYLPKVDVVYSSNLCFSKDVNSKIGEKLKLSKSGALFFCSKEVTSLHLINIGQVNVTQSWANDQKLFIYQRR